MFRIYQLVCRVKDLRAAVRDFEVLGFEVEWGSKPEKAYNANIKFKNGPMIELFTMPDIAYYLSYIRGVFYGKGARQRWQKWCCAQEGICDFNLKGITSKTGNILNFETICAQVSEERFPLCPIVKGSRKDESGRVLRYKYCMPRLSEFPMLSSDYHIPVSENIKHAHKNGAKEISRIVIGVQPEHEAKMNNLLAADERVEIIKSDATKILKIHIEGMNATSSTNNLHGIHLI